MGSSFILIIAFIVFVIMAAFIVVLKKQYDKVYLESLKTQDELSSVMNNGHIGVWKYDIVNHHMCPSKQWSEILGIPVDKHTFTYKIFLNFVLPDYQREVEKAFKDYIEGKTRIYHVRYKVRSLHHGDIWVEDFGKIVERNDDAEGIVFVGFAKNITAQVDQDENVSKRLAMLQAVVNEEKMEFWEWDLEKDLITVDEFFANIPGHVAGERISPREFFEGVHKDDADGLSKELSQFLSGKRPVLNYEFRRQLSKDTIEWVRVTGIIYQRGADGKPNHVAGLTTDITERMTLKEHLKEDEEKVQTLTRELVAKEEVIKSSVESNTEFIVGIAKEIRSPLNVLLGITEVMLEKDLSNEQSEHFQSIKDASKLICRLSEEMTDISKIESGQLKIMNEPFDVVQLLRKAFRVEAGKAQINYRKLIAPLIYGDSKRLAQVVGIILDNIQHTIRFPEISVDVDLIFFEEKENLEIYVTAFEKEDWAGPEGEFPPINRGVAMVQKIVELMEGRLETGIEPNGVHFYRLTVPHNPITVESRATKSEKSKVPLKEINATILVVDDSEANRELIRLYLKDYPFTLVMAKDGIEAVQQFQRNKIDLVFMDIQMPLMDGHEATQIIRKVEKDHEQEPVPIISVSAYVMHDEIEKCFSAGCNSTLLKPVKKTSLIDELRKFL